jgi:hypothetical protein
MVPDFGVTAGVGHAARLRRTRHANEVVRIARYRDGLGDLDLCRRLAGLFDPIHDGRRFNCTQAGSISAYCEQGRARNARQKPTAPLKATKRAQSGHCCLLGLRRWWNRGNRGATRCIRMCALRRQRVSCPGRLWRLARVLKRFTSRLKSHTGLLPPLIDHIGSSFKSPQEGHHLLFYLGNLCVQI